MTILDALSSARRYLVGATMGEIKYHAAYFAPQKEITIESIYVHPIKSCKGSQVQEAQITHDGLLYDRTWLIVDRTSKKFCTARELSKMVLINPHIDLSSGKLIIDVPLTEKGKGTKRVQTDLDPTREQLEKMELVEGISIWNHTVDGYVVSEEVNEVLSEFFGKSVMLVRKGPLDRPSGPDDRRDRPTLNYQDFYPLLVATQASLKHVQQTLVKSVYPSMSPQTENAPVDPNDRAAQIAHVEIPAVRVPDSVSKEYWTPEQLETLEITRFRPNIILKSTPAGDMPALAPWEEDGFVELELFDAEEGHDGGEPPFGDSAKGQGKLGISCMARAGRCLVPNIDPSTGNRDPHIPYKPMQKYRQVDEIYNKMGKPCFGVLAALKEGTARKGVIRVGDIVRVTETTDPAQRNATPKPS
ncbi:hypothetical protein BCV69DRAFT_301090 [Microstroma glucosiphilum]|uniref:MOSC domain-containing protein n=1 Tax=Pseudomicrostroma glucosiphilum TaxID=1684307 RepID=A0A316TZF8_9BASI|nr:hypothetical protein BCV69DRAFT_301090 [Pseudomicrostroma glucosiphilum]PWN18609.1 hypothetical protein BCV69DRAFT_301090 [Pseudomicrostroma glucosiphilum]